MLCSVNINDSMQWGSCCFLCSVFSIIVCPFRLVIALSVRLSIYGFRIPLCCCSSKWTISACVRSGCYWSFAKQSFSLSINFSFFLRQSKLRPIMLISLFQCQMFYLYDNWTGHLTFTIINMCNNEKSENLTLIVFALIRCDCNFYNTTNLDWKM